MSQSKKNGPGIVDQTIPGCSREKRGKKNEKKLLALLLALSLYPGDIKKLSPEILNKYEVEENGSCKFFVSMEKALDFLEK